MTKRKAIYLFILTMILAGSIGAWIFMKSGATQMVLPKESATLTSPIRQVMLNHVARYEGKSGSQEQWFLQKAPVPDKPNSFLAAKETIIPFKERVANILQQYKHFSPFTEEVVTAFARPFFSIYVNGIAVIPVLSKGEMDARPPNDLEICLIPEKEFSDDHPARIYYKKGWEAVMVVTTEFPKTIFPALLLHEMGHAYLHKIKKAPSAFALQGSDLYIEEEVQMHELEAEIMNSASDGKYYEAADRILAGMKGAGSFLEVLDKIKVNHLMLMDKALGCPPCSAGVIGIVTAQHYYVLGFRFIQKSSSLKKEDNKKRLYGVISSAVMGTKWGSPQ